MKAATVDVMEGVVVESVVCRGVCKREEIEEEGFARWPHRGGRGGGHGSEGTGLCCRGEGSHGMIGLGRMLE